MRKIIALEFISLDGVIQAPGGPEEDSSGGFEYGGWGVPHFDELLGTVMSNQMNRPFALLLGRTTYEIFASYWPHHSDEWPGINEAKKYVVSHEDIELEWDNSVLLKDDIAVKIKNLKEEDGPDLHVYGSGNLMQTLLKHDLVDELWLKIFPITIGSGKRLFAGGTIPTALELTDYKVSQKGVIVANYTRAGDLQTGSF